MLSSCHGRCVKPPRAERLLVREPNAALLLGPRIGQHLGEAGDREICRRGPGAARSAEPLRQFERIGEVRCYSRLTWADVKSNVLKENPRALDGAGVGSKRSFLRYGRKQSWGASLFYCRAVNHRWKTSLQSCSSSEAAIIA